MCLTVGGGGGGGAGVLPFYYKDVFNIYAQKHFFPYHQIYILFFLIKFTIILYKKGTD